MLHRSQRNYGCRIHDEYQYKGMNTVVLENELVRISVLPDKGTEIFEFLYKPLDLDVMWLSANGVLNPQHTSSSADPEHDFLDHYSGGWQEVFPNGGAPSSYRGIQFGQHDEVAHAKWDWEIIHDSPDQVAVAFFVKTRKMPFLIKKKLTLSSNSGKLILEESIENNSDARLPAMWGHHIAFGPPFLEPGCFIKLDQGEKINVIPHPEAIADSGRRVSGRERYDWPLAKDQKGNVIDLSVLPEAKAESEMLYLMGFDPKLAEARYTVFNPRRNVSVSVAWDSRLFPYLWFWQEYGANMDYPWYGRNYNIGLEPFSSYPTNGLGEAVENGTALWFEPKEQKQIGLTLEIHSDGS